MPGVLVKANMRMAMRASAMAAGTAAMLMLRTVRIFFMPSRPGHFRFAAFAMRGFRGCRCGGGLKTLTVKTLDRFRAVSAEKTESENEKRNT